MQVVKVVIGSLRNDQRLCSPAFYEIVGGEETFLDDDLDEQQWGFLAARLPGGEVTGNVFHGIANSSCSVSQGTARNTEKEKRREGLPALGPN